MTAASGRPGPIDRSVGERIRTLRESEGDSLHALAQALGCDPAELAACEAGRLRAGADTLIRIAHRYRVEIAYFYGGLSGQVFPVPAPEGVVLGPAD